MDDISGEKLAGNFSARQAAVQELISDNYMSSVALDDDLNGNEDPQTQNVMNKGLGASLSQLTNIAEKEEKNYEWQLKW